MKRSRRWKEAISKVDRFRDYQLEEGLTLLKEFTAKTKFDETVELTVNLGVDPRKADQMVRGTVTLPHGTGKEVRVLVLTPGEKQVEAREAGADHVGFDEFIEKIQRFFVYSATDLRILCGIEFFISLSEDSILLLSFRTTGL